QAQQPEHERRRIVSGKLVALREPANIMGGVHIGLTARQSQPLDSIFVILSSVEDMRSTVVRPDVGSADGTRTHRTNSHNSTQTRQFTLIPPAERPAVHRIA